MKIIYSITFVLFLFSSFINVNAQVQNSTEKEITRKYLYHYSFESGSSAELIKQTEEAISKLIHVTEVKSVFKPESGRGQFIITVTEKDRTTESEELFSPKLVKEVILQNGIQPIDFTVTEEIIK